jgi:hypothetical protein
VDDEPAGDAGEVDDEPAGDAGRGPPARADPSHDRRGWVGQRVVGRPQRVVDVEAAPRHLARRADDERRPAGRTVPERARTGTE